jgi:NDP-sugar pyrophosphorylase family protein
VNKLKEVKTILPISVAVIAGGKGTRLLPLTANKPKPLIEINNKPIIEYNFDLFIKYGVNDVSISTGYLAEQIVDKYNHGYKSAKFKFYKENEALGTLGAVSLMDNFENDYVLVMNSDLLTNVDLEDLFNTFIDLKADVVIATIPYKVDVPYAIFNTEGSTIVGLEEKPTYTYFSNAGIYIFRREHIEKLNYNEYMDAPDFIKELIKGGKKVISYPIVNYWLDIGKHDDYAKAQEDVKHIKF